MSEIERVAGGGFHVAKLKLFRSFERGNADVTIGWPKHANGRSPFFLWMLFVDI